MRWQTRFFDWLWKRPEAQQPPPATTPARRVPPPVPSPVPATPAPTQAITSPSNACIALIKSIEGCLYIAEKDVDGVYILGYGNKIFDGVQTVAGQTTNAAGADRNVRRHAQECASGVLASVKVVLTQGQLDSLTDFVYNVGIGGFRSSTILKTLNARLPVTEEMFTRWNKVRQPDGALKVLAGLTRRRKAEYQLFIS